MHPLMVLLNLAAAVLLLLWAVRMVRTGFERAYGHRMKDGLRRYGSNLPGAALAGLVLAVLLQSSTAAGILAAGFASSGLLPLSSALAALLGADLGSALVVRVLLLDLSWIMPLLMVAGVTAFLRFEDRLIRQTGRILIGIALVLVALRLIGDATEPIRDNPALVELVAHLDRDPVTAAALAALFAWLVHSGVAAVLLLSTFVSRGVVPLETALPMVLGINVGAGLVGVWLTRAMPPVARRVPVGNAIFRSGAALAGLAAFSVWPDIWPGTGAPASVEVVHAHIVFNAALAFICIPLAPLMTRLTSTLIPDVDVAEPDPFQRVSLLDRSVIATPKLALASATREVLHMGETVEGMFAPLADLFESGDPNLMARIRRMDGDVNRAHRDIKLYIAEVNRGQLDEADAQRGIELTDVAINLEHAGDIISKTLLPLIEDKVARQLAFSPDGWREILDLHARVADNMRLVLNVLISGDLESARQVVREKERVRQLERSSHDRHLQRLQAGVAESLATSNIHLEVLRGLKEINSLLASTAYPMLANSGQLLGSRLAGTN